MVGEVSRVRQRGRVAIASAVCLQPVPKPVFVWTWTQFLCAFTTGVIFTFVGIFIWFFALGRLMVRLGPQNTEFFVDQRVLHRPLLCHVISSTDIRQMCSRALWRARVMSYLQSLKPWKDLRVLFSKLKLRMQPVSNLNLFLHVMRNTVTSPFDLPWETDEWSRLLTRTETSWTSCSLRLHLGSQM